MRLKDILKEAANAKMAFKRLPATSLAEDKPKVAPSDEKLKSMGNKKAAEMTDSELAGVTRSLDKEKDFKLKKSDVDASCVTDGYGNDVEIDVINPHATEQRADAEVENLKEMSGAIRMRNLLSRILPESGDQTDNGEANPPKIEPQGEPHKKSDSQAADQAHKLNLTAKPYGNWADDTGKVVAKTVKGQLTKLDPKEKQAKNADAPTDSGEVAPKSPAPKQSAGEQEPSSKLSQNVPSGASDIKLQMKAAQEAIQQYGSAKQALAAHLANYAEVRKLGDANKTKEAVLAYTRFGKALRELATDASSDLYNTMEELQERGQGDYPANKYLKAIVDMGSEIEQDWSATQISDKTNAMAYDISRKYNEQLAANSQAIDPDEVEADMEELRDAIGRDTTEDEREYTAQDYAADKADDEYDEWASSGKPKYWHGRRMR